MNPTIAKRLKAAIFGAYVTTAVLSIYTIVSTLGSAIVTLLPYLAGTALFAVLLLIFVSALVMQSKVRSAKGKSLAVKDIYQSLAVLSILGYVLAACVATFQPGADPSPLWSNAVILSLVWMAIFAVGKYIPELYRAGGNN